MVIFHVMDTLVSNYLYRIKLVAIITPNIDRLALEGLRFTQFYTADPICSPSRSALLTGRLPVRNGVYSQTTYPEDLIFRVFFPWSSGGIRDYEITIAKALKNKGYQSAIIGKWHLGHYDGSLPTQNGGFDYFYGLPYSQDEGCPPGKGFPCTKWEEIWPPVPLFRNEEIIEQPVDLLSLTPRYNQEAKKFIENSTKSNTPFFLYMAYDEVHVPLFASTPFQNTSRRGLFGDAAREMDDSIGQIIQYLKQLNIDKNTFVFFTSDNGPFLMEGIHSGSAGLFRGGKGETWEGGIREPGIAWWPGTITPSITLEPATTMDLFATVLDLAGVPIPNDRVIDGKSFASLLKGKSNFTHSYLFFHRNQEVYAVRHKQYKAHFITRSGFGLDPPKHHDPPILYNIEVDPSENYPIDPSDPVFNLTITKIKNALIEHQNSIKFVDPQLDDLNVMVGPCCDEKTKCFCN